jgi:pimeloyl-ACP methyl ester carboxylesterase
MATARVKDIELHYDVTGDGPPLLLVSGLGLSSLAWTGVLPELAREFTCITVDNRGTGRSEAPPGPYSIDEMADDVAALLRQLDLGPVMAVGWSLGGSVMQSLLIRHGDLLERAVLLSAFPSYTPLQHAWLDAGLTVRRNGLDPVSVALNAMAWSYTPRLLADHGRAVAQAQLSAQNPHPTSLKGFEAQAAGLRVYDSRAGLPNVSTPVLVLVGAEDVLTPPAQSVEMAELIPTATLRVLPRGGHAMVLEYPTDTFAAIVEYLQKGS